MHTSKFIHHACMNKSITIITISNRNNTETFTYKKMIFLCYCVVSIYTFKVYKTYYYYMIMIGTKPTKRATLGGSKNRKTATKCAKTHKTVSKIVENHTFQQIRNFCIFTCIIICMGDAFWSCVIEICQLPAECF